MPDTNLFGVQIPEAHSIENMIDGQLQGQSVQLQFPEDLPKYYCILDFTNYSFSSTSTGNGAGTANGSITLPLPVNLLDKHTVRYDEKPVAGVLASLPTLLAGQAGQVAIDVAGTPLKAMTGLAPNWYQTIMFDRPEYKRHELQFKLAPRNFAESETIRNIITELNNKMAPDVETGGTGASVLFKFPEVVKVTLKPNTGFLYKFRPAVIEMMAINYNGGAGQKAFYHDQANGGDGENPPESVEITLNLIEIQYWIKNAFTNTNE